MPASPQFPSSSVVACPAVTGFGLAVSFTYGGTGAVFVIVISLAIVPHWLVIDNVCLSDVELSTIGPNHVYIVSFPPPATGCWMVTPSTITGIVEGPLS